MHWICVSITKLSGEVREPATPPPSSSQRSRTAHRATRRGIIRSRPNS
jgi:hypothetical protein